MAESWLSITFDVLEVAVSATSQLNNELVFKQHQRNVFDWLLRHLPKAKNSGVSLTCAFDDFILSRKAMRCSEKTLRTYISLLGRFIQWLEKQGVSAPIEITNQHIRKFLAEIQGKPWTLNGYGRAIRTLMRFWYQEGYIQKELKVIVPSVPKQRLPFLTVDQITKILDVCDLREKALFMFMLDSGLRRQEVCNLDLRNIDLKTGAVRVVQGKGKKDRLAVIGENTRQVLCEYLNTLPSCSENDPVFRTVSGRRFTGEGLQSFYERLSKKVGFKVTAHMVRRTFATLCLKLGMDIASLQLILGHSSIETTRQYIQLLDDDLITAHRKASPADRLCLK